MDLMRKKVVKQPRDLSARTKQFEVSRNSAVDSIIAKKQRRGWLRLLWKKYSVAAIICSVILGILLLVHSTM